MTTLMAIYFVITAAFVVALMLGQGFREKTDLLSLRNFFLVGFIIFQLTSAALSLHLMDFGDFRVADPVRTGLIYLVVTTIFLVLFLFAYRRGWVVNAIAARLPTRAAMPGVTGLFSLAFIFAVSGIIIKFGFSTIPAVAVLADMFGVGLLAAAAGIAGWVWAPRVLNPAVATMAVAVLILAVLPLLFHAFGRRELLGVLAAFGWGAYHGHWKHLGPKAALVRFLAVGLVGITFLAIFTGARAGAQRERTVGQTVAAMRQTDIRQGYVQLATGQYAAANSMWVVETRPRDFRYDTLHTARYVLLHPIPRALLPGKPDALARIAPAQARIRGKARNWSIGPGIIGHVYNDNPWIALLIYPVALGLMLRFADELVRLHPYNPFVVIPMGVALGQVIGLARGEAGLFLFWAIVSIIAAFLAMYIVAAVLSSLGWQMHEEPVWDQAEEDAGALEDHGDGYGAWA